MESYIQIAFLNDFIFCPRSIYFHNLVSSNEKILYDDAPQIEGTAAHQAIDNQKYSTSKHIFQGLEVYCEQYKLAGKIDLYDEKTKTLIERKRLIKTIYDGYIFQIYAQYFAMIEMGYIVEHLQFYSKMDNKKYPILLPDDNIEMKNAFENLITNITAYNLNAPFEAHPQKCKHCIYNVICDKSRADEILT